jgi:hypothetical protein
MRPGAALLAALLAMKAVLYLPITAFALLGWHTCGRDAWAAAAMVPVPGQVLRTAYTGNRPNRGFHVDYSYCIGGHDRVGHALVLCNAWASGSALDHMQRRQNQVDALVGRPVTVWVEPARPANAVLERYVPRAALVVIGGGLLFLAIVTIDLDRRGSRRLRRRFAAP